MRAEAVLCKLFVALLGAGLSDLAKQNAGVAQLAAQLPCKQTVAGSIPAAGTGLCDDFRHVSQPQNPGKISSGSTNITHRVAKQAGVALDTQ